MDLLQVKGDQIVDEQGRAVWLRGVCVGGWMNMEDFINGYPGPESGLRAAMAQALGPAKAEFFFDRWLDVFFAEEDVQFLKSLGCSVVRLPLNYRHFEHDLAPFQYLEKGFARLQQAVEWCRKHELYVILDLHAVQGWQNTDWHCDNASRHTLFWTHRQFQDRFVALWEEFARRFRGDPVIAGYNVMNEPVANAPRGLFDAARYEPGFDALNQVYRRVVAAIRAIDPEHIIFLEGDFFSNLFDGLDDPHTLGANIAYSSHNYSPAGFGPGAYPNPEKGWDRAAQEKAFNAASGTKFARQHGVPLWVGEFGSAYNGPAAEIPDRLRALDDQLAVFNQNDAHWTMWVYKDIHVMGWVQAAPGSAYVQRIAPVLEGKQAVYADYWMGWSPATPVKESVHALAAQIQSTLGAAGLEVSFNPRYLEQSVLSGFTAVAMQPAFAAQFAGLDEGELESAVQSFRLEQCRPHQGLLEVVRSRVVA